MTELGEFALYVACGAVGVMIVGAFAPILKALAHRISHGQDGAGLEARVAELEARLATLEDKSPRTDEVVVPADRLREIEERVDFAERVLTRADDTARIARGQP